MTSLSLWPAMVLTALPTLAPAAVITPKVEILEIHGPNTVVQNGGCPAGTLAHEVQVWDGGFSIAFTPSDRYFRVDTSSWRNSHSSCSIDVSLMMPFGTCYMLKEFIVTGDAFVEEGNTLALSPAPQTYVLNPSTDYWHVDSTFHIPPEADIDISGPYVGSFLRLGRPVNLSGNRRPLGKCERITRLNLDLQALMISHSTRYSEAKIARFIYSFTTNKFGLAGHPTPLPMMQ
jgi:hypothetical protein